MPAQIIHSISELVQQDKVSFDSHGCDRFMDYSGSIMGVYEILGKAFQKPDLERDLDFFLFANRLLSGVIDYGLRTKENILGLKHSVEDICLQLYRGEYESARESLSELPLTTEMLESPVLEKKDKISWTAFKPGLIKKLIRKIRPRGNISILPDYIILDGHDAYRPGFMLASHFDGMRICAIRNAQDSKRDMYPRPLAGEENYLRQQLYNKDVLILGEDVSTGRALGSLNDFIVSVSRPRHIFTAAPVYIPGDPLDIDLDYFAEERTSFQ